MWVELIILEAIAIYVMSYRMQSGEGVYDSAMGLWQTVYNKYAPYSYKSVQEKSKKLGIEYSTKEYISQVIMLGGGYMFITYFYFYSIPMALIYGVVAMLFVPYLSYLRNTKAYSEFIFEQIQSYCSTVINEFNTTQSFVKAMEGCRDSGILEEPLLTDVSTMINLSYQNGTIDEAIEWFNGKYPYYMVKNMHQLFLQITKEGAQDSGESLENMMNDIDLLVEGVYRDKMDRVASHSKFLLFGFCLYFLVILVKLLLNDSYQKMLSLSYVQILLHGVIWINSYFLISGEKFYNEDTGVE